MATQEAKRRRRHVSASLQSGILVRQLSISMLEKCDGVGESCRNAFVDWRQSIIHNGKHFAHAAAWT